MTYKNHPEAKRPRMMVWPRWKLGPSASG
jgi:hypothetical protein